MSLPQPLQIAEAQPVGREAFHGEVRAHGEPRVFRGLAAQWPAVAAAGRGDRAMADYLLACAQDRLGSQEPLRFANEVALTVVMAANGYPDIPEKGGRIDLGNAEADGAVVFHAGTARDEEDDHLIANGGRVLNVTATGADTKAAQEAAYAAVDRIDFASGFCRRDIGWREIARGS